MFRAKPRLKKISFNYPWSNSNKLSANRNFPMSILLSRHIYYTAISRNIRNRAREKKLQIIQKYKKNIKIQKYKKKEREISVTYLFIPLFHE